MPKPQNLDLMLEIASRLSTGFPQMRVDLYEVDGKVYFGELTMTSMAGRMNYFTPNILKSMGSLCKNAFQQITNNG